MKAFISSLKCTVALIAALCGLLALPACTSTELSSAATELNSTVNSLTESSNVAAITEALTTAGVIDSTQAAEITAIAAVANSASDSLAASSATASTTTTTETKAIKPVSSVKLLEAQAIKGVLARGFDASKLPAAKAKLAYRGLKL